MRLKSLVQVMIVSCGLLGLAACASLGHKKDSDMTNVSDANGPQTSGLGDGSAFGSDLTPEQLLAKKTYYFQFDRSDVSAEDKAAIFANADNVIAQHGLKIVLEGHTDPQGSREYNVALGERRANAVAELLKSRGVSPDQIRVVSYGAERLAAPGHTEADYQLDRRVVLIVQQ